LIASVSEHKTRLDVVEHLIDNSVLARGALLWTAGYEARQTELLGSTASRSSSSSRATLLGSSGEFSLLVFLGLVASSGEFLLRVLEEN
jgi:hypothetical protein